MFIFCIVFIGLTFGSTSLDNKKDYDSTQKIITIKNNLDNILAEYKLIYNTDQCLIDCYAEGIANLKIDGKLFTRLRFRDKKGWKSIIDNKILLKINKSYQIAIPDYKQICEIDINGTEICWNEKVGSHKEIRYKEVWQEYQREILTAGIYKWRIEGKKTLLENVDWIASAYGVELTEWTWWNNDWKARKNITIQGGSSTLTNFTVYINVTYDSDMQSDFDDIRFINGSCEGVQTDELSYELDSKTDSEVAGFWVKIPDLVVGDNLICMYYRNLGASSTSDGVNAWDDDYLSIYHMNNFNDSKGKYNGTAVSDPESQEGGVFGNNTYFDGNDAIDLGFTHYLGDINAITIEAWANSSGALTTYQGIVDREASAPSRSWSLRFNQDNPEWHTYNSSADGQTTTATDTTLSQNTVYYFVGHYNSTGQGIWLDGLLNQSNNSYGNLYGGTIKICIGGITQGEELFLTGTIDEVRISNTTRSVEWINRSYWNYDTDLVVFGVEESEAEVTITLNSPSDNYVTILSSIEFNASIESDINLFNATLYVWNSDGSVYDTNYTDLSSLNTKSTNVSRILSGFVLGSNYIWNYYACDTGDVCDWADSNWTFYRGLGITTFNVSLTEENLTFTGDENITRYLDIPRYSNVTSAYMNLSGYKYTNFIDYVSNFSLNDQWYSGYHMASNSTNLWIRRSGISPTYEKYLIDGTYLGSWNPSATVLLYGIYTNNTYIWVCDAEEVIPYTRNIEWYDMGETSIGRFNLSAENHEPRGIVVADNYVYVADIEDDKIYKYNMSGYLKSSYSIASGFRDFAYNDNEFFVTNDSSKLTIYNMSWDYINSKEINTSINNPYGITYDGTNFWIADATDDQRIIYSFASVYPHNPYLEIGTTDGIHEWNYTGEFNETHSPNRTLDLSSAINSALNDGACDCTGCNIIGSNCSIPFLFHSDTAGILEYSDIDIYYETTPHVELVSPLNDTWAGLTETFECNVTDDYNLKNITFYLWNSTSIINDTETTNITGTYNSSSFNITFPRTDDYTWNCLAYNEFENYDWAESNYTIKTDAVPPDINVTNPLNTTYTSNANIELRYTISDAGVGLDSCWWSTNSGVTNNSITCGNNVTLNATQGSNIWIVYANDTVNNLNSSSVTFTIAGLVETEGTWFHYAPKINKQTRWKNSLTVKSYLNYDYTASLNITADTLADSSTTKVKDQEGDDVSSTFDSSSGNISWEGLIYGYIAGTSNETYFEIYYNTTKINLTSVNYTLTEDGYVYETYNLTAIANSTRTITSAYVYFNFSDINIVSNILYNCTNAVCDVDISDRADVTWSDVDGDGAYDKVEWFVNSITHNRSYQLKNLQGYPIEVTQDIDILNPPIKPFDNVEWRNTITMYNPNSYPSTKTFKLELPFGSRDITLDDVSKNLLYDPFGTLQPYILIIDKDDPSHTESVYLGPGETKTFRVEYISDSITVYSSTYFPAHYEVDEMALIIYILKIKNQADDTVTDIEYRIPINYGEDLIVCEGERTDGCIEDKDDPLYKNITLDTKDSVKGDYKLEIESINATAVKYVTLSFYIPTVTLDSKEEGRRSVQGVLTNFQRLKFHSEAPFKLDDVRYKSGIKDAEIVKILECDWRNICEIPLIFSNGEVKLKTFTVNEEKIVFLWWIPEEEMVPAIGLSWIAKLWNWGHEFVLEKGSFWFYLLGWAGTQDEEGNKILYTGGLIIILLGVIIVVVGMILIIWRKKIFIKKAEKTETFK